MEPQQITPTIPSQPVPIEQKPPRSNKTFKIILLIFLFLLLGAVITYAIGNYQAEQTNLVSPTEPTPTQVVDKMSEMKTYTNEEYGFEFEYPSTWLIEEYAHPDFGSLKVALDPLKLSKTELEPNFGIDIHPGLISIYAENRKYTNIFGRSDPLEGTTNREKVQIGPQNIPAYVTDQIDEDAANPSLANTHQVSYLIIKPDYYITIQYVGDLSKNDQYLNEFEDIISTFKFL